MSTATSTTTDATTTDTDTSSTELKIVSLSDWWNDESFEHKIPLLDVRTQNDHDEKCLHSSKDSDSSSTTALAAAVASATAVATIVHIPLENLEERSYELPPRHIVFALLIPDESSIPSLQELLLGGTNTKTNTNAKRRQKPWKVPYGILASDPNNWRLAESLGLMKVKGTDSDTASLHTPPKFRAMPRLWQPDPMVQQVLLPVLNNAMATSTDLTENSTTMQDSDCSEIWDLGAGSGRDVCFLAEQLRETLTLTSLQSQHTNCNFKVAGLDQRYQAVASNEECTRFWKRRGVGENTASRKIRLEDWDAFSAELQRVHENENAHILCLFAVRFWNRLLVERLVSSPLIAPGTIFAISQFGKPSTGATWDFVHPKVSTELELLVDRAMTLATYRLDGVCYGRLTFSRFLVSVLPQEKHVLERYELRDLFAPPTGANWKVLYDEVALDSDHGRTMIHFVAERLSQS
jgi:hypothetical protein